MTTEDLIRELFYRVDEMMKDGAKHPQASVWPSEGSTRGGLFALQGGGHRACYRGGSRAWRGLFPALPARTRRLRLWALHRAWPDECRAAPAVLGVGDR